MRQYILNDLVEIGCRGGDSQVSNTMFRAALFS